MTQRPWNCICNNPQHKAFCKCLQMIISLERGKTIWEMFMSEMALLWEIVFFSRSLKCSWLFSLLGLSPVRSRIFRCLNIKTLSDVWLWMNRDQALQRPILWLSTGTWAELRRVFGPVARRLAGFRHLMCLKGLQLASRYNTDPLLSSWGWASALGGKNPQKNKKRFTNYKVT